MDIFLSAATSFFFGFLITPVLIFLLKKGNIIDAPGGRKIHSGFVPSMGGIGIVLATFAGVFAWFSLDQLVQTRYFLVALGIMFSVGLRDDLIELSAMQKLIGQCIPAFFVIIMADIRITGLYGFMGIYEIPYLVSITLSFLLIIVLTNSFNLIDGLDGLAGTLSVISLTFLGWWFFMADMVAYSLIAFTMVGGVLSFLAFNWHPAKIFMGDTGSLSLGFALTTLVILFIDTNGNMLASEGWKINAPITAGIALMIVPIYDTIRIFTKRSLKGKSPLKPDKSHVHHFLLRMGYRHNEVSVILGSIKLVFISMVMLGHYLNDHVMLPLVLSMAILLGIWLDERALKRVKMLNRHVPARVAARTVKKFRTKPTLIDKVFDHEKINMN
ncbi:MAG TPA: MraY family glycosyltransferase [Cyclobacteriaceae bacterium]|nr:MraY family glycosyltransferase [Cyclobacteriaceae bacterium]